MSSYAGSALVRAMGIALLAIPLMASTVTFNLGGTACSTGSPLAPAGLCSAVPSHLIDFDAWLGLGSPQVEGIATFAFTPPAPSPFVTGSVDNEYAAPGRLAAPATQRNDQTPYLSVGSPTRTGMVTITFAAPIVYYGLYLGSPDQYNVISFYENSGDATPVRTFTGHDLIPPANGNQEVSEYINFHVAGGSIEKIVMTSSQAAFETDNHAYAAVPEPDTLLMCGLGGVLFWANRMRRGKRGATVSVRRV